MGGLARWWALAALGCAPAAASLGGGAEPPATRVPIADRYARARLDLVAAINDDRRRAGVPAVAIDSLATVVAQTHADAMAGERFFSHFASTGEAPYERLAAAGGRGHVRENIYRWAERRSDPYAAGDPWDGFDVVEAERSLMSSPGHRETILDAGRTHVGIGIAVDPRRRTVLVVQDFVARRLELEAPRRAWRRAPLPVAGRARAGERPLAVVVRREPFPRAWAERGDPPPAGAYPDGGEDAGLVPPWAIDWWAGDRSFSLAIPLGAAAPARYYAIVLVAPEAVVERALSRRSVSTAEGTPGGAFVVDVF